MAEVKYKLLKDYVPPIYRQQSVSLEFFLDPKKTILKSKIQFSRDNGIPTDLILQGNINPNKIKKGGKELEAEVNRLLISTKGRNHIYCSGHGLLPDTPIKNVERVIEIIKNWYVSHYQIVAHNISHYMDGRFIIPP